ncbi:hypothetical protein M1146_01080 [Patescibacteria group bacterium]|nr:hypothetical protein [Patescibacteria group bacterium]
MPNIRRVRSFFKDERGEMSHLIDDDAKITSALVISSKRGSIRANHYHKKDTHYSYMIKGEMEYFSRPVKSKSKKLNKTIVREGEIVKTPPLTIHAMRFIKDSIFLALTTEARDQKKYEKDTVRIKVI